MSSKNPSKNLNFLDKKVLTGKKNISIIRGSLGGVAEWLKATDCKSVLSEYAGSNPAPSTRQNLAAEVSCRVSFVCGCSSMVEPKPSKLKTRVRFPSPAPSLKFCLCMCVVQRAALVAQW